MVSQSPGERWSYIYMWCHVGILFCIRDTGILDFPCKTLLVPYTGPFLRSRLRDDGCLSVNRNVIRDYTLRLAGVRLFGTFYTTASIYRRR